jgi:hypothetical protein
MEPTDPLRVVDGFLEARNARDVVGAAGWCDTVAWSERLTPRSIHFPEALASSVIVDVRVVVQDGRITNYQAAYPRQPSSQGVGTAPESTPPVAPLTLFGVTAVGLVLVAAVVAGGQKGWPSASRG